ncbi:hypothetical protein GOP47_0007191 [Adiantum capillus-veneris]|uniref:Uncharacterized protein n=1 Tax=Adiantum capillus-veneris TaxID=13818 RepID=A0A9D4V1N2_ADICA|nr:hypothetical protein GOP47_0007191 [Adiantum capillus-veneris]
MPHKFKQASHRRLFHVKEASDGEEDVQDETNDPACKSALNLVLGKEKMGPSETLAMEGKYAKIESSPLPLQRALLSSAVSKKCGPSTPVPSWKMYDIPFQGATDAASFDANPSLLTRGITASQSRNGRNMVSARKLAASLWEMQGAFNSSHHQVKDKLKSQHHGGLVSSEHHHKGREEPAEQALGSHQGRSVEDKRGSSKQPKASISLSKGSNSRSSGSLMSHAVSRFMAVDVVQLREEEDGSTLSCELVKVLNQIWSLEEQYNDSTSLVASLRSELKKTRASIKELQKEQSSYHEDLEMMKKKLDDEKKMLQDRAEEAVLVAVKPLKEELEIERKSNIKLEVKHKKMSKEMSETRKTLTKTMQEFEREKKARELMEDVCDELAREIGEDKAQVEELKKQSAKYREEVEQERRMLQMAEVWREERVHMKLAEARFELEEKNAALDKLRSELEAFLRAKRSLDEGNNGDASKFVSSLEEAASSVVCAGDDELKQGSHQPSKNTKAPADVLLDEKRSGIGVGLLEGEDSLDDDLHSIELNRISSYSGSHEGPLSVQGNSMKSKVSANGKHSPSVVASFPRSQNEVNNNSKQGEMSNLRLDRISSSFGKAMMPESITSEIQEVESHPLGRESERELKKDWDLGKGIVAWSNGAFPSLWLDSNEDSVGSNSKGRSGSGQKDSLSKSRSKGETTGAADMMDLKLEIFELPRDPRSEAQDGGGLLSSGSKTATFPSSPTRKWTHSWSSHDPARSSKASLESVAQGFKDNSLKARLLEAKLENQQAKARNSKAAPVS